MKKPFLLLVILLLTVQLSCNFPLSIVSPTGDPAAVVPNLLGRTDANQWMAWVLKLSGAQPVEIAGETVNIETRYDYAMFTGQPNARAFDYILQQVRTWYPEDQIEVDEYTYTDAETSYTWKNLIITIPGKKLPEESILLTAHLDSTAVRDGDAMLSAPGADDNATGSAALLEAARLFDDYNFERTIKIIWFSGEEHGLQGSSAYTQDHSLDGIVGVINLDMIGYDSNGDRCFEIHAGVLPASDAIGKVFTASVTDLSLGLTYDYLTDLSTDRSDHSSFWAKNVPAITIIENFLDQGVPGGCQGEDINPGYHRPDDTVDKINIDYGFAIVKAALASTAKLAVPMPSYFAPAVNDQ